MTTSDRDRRAQRRQDVAYRLHLAGASYAEIAESKDPDTKRPLYASSGAAYAAVQAAIKRHTEAGSKDDQLRQVEASRLDRLQRALWPAAIAGDAAAAREVRQLIIARTRLLGLEAKSATPSEPPKGDPVDELAAKRAARRAAASDS